MSHSLESLREQMEEINKEILLLLNKRVNVSLQIRDIKTEQEIPFFDSKRESKMLQLLLEANKGPASQELVKKFFQEVFSMSRQSMEKPHR